MDVISYESLNFLSNKHLNKYILFYVLSELKLKTSHKVLLNKIKKIHCDDANMTSFNFIFTVI